MWRRGEVEWKGRGGEGEGGGEGRGEDERLTSLKQKILYVLLRVIKKILRKFRFTCSQIWNIAPEPSLLVKRLQYFYAGRPCNSLLFCVILSNFSRKSKKEKMSEKMRKLHELPYMSCLTWAALHGNDKKEWLKHGFLPTCTKKTKTCHLFFAAFRTSFAKIRIVAQLSFCPSVSNGMFAWLWNAFFGFFWIASVFVRSLTFTIVLLLKWDPRGPPRLKSTESIFSVGLCMENFDAARA